MKNLLRTITAAVLACVLCAGCSTQKVTQVATLEDVAPYRNDSAFLPRIPVPEVASLYQLTEAQYASFDSWFDHPSRRSTPAFRRVADYLEAQTRNFSYRGETLAASEALAWQSGNCLSLAILTTALAQHVNVPVRHQLMVDAPVFDLHDTVVQKGVHVRTRLIDSEWLPEDDVQALRRPGILIDYFPTGRERFIGNLTLAEFSARYYRNNAADALVEGQLARAYWYSIAALEQAPNDAESLNALAITYRHAGMNELAERTYRHGITLADNKLSLMKNLHVLLLAEGREVEAAEVEQELAHMRDPSPARWYLLARDAMAAGDMRAAIGYLETAVDLAPHLHELQAALAKAYYLDGQRGKARKAFAKAIKNALEPGDRSRYEGKLAALTRH